MKPNKQTTLHFKLKRLYNKTVTPKSRRLHSYWKIFKIEKHWLNEICDKGMVKMHELYCTPTVLDIASCRKNVSNPSGNDITRFKTNLKQLTICRCRPSFTNWCWKRRRENSNISETSLALKLRRFVHRTIFFVKITRKNLQTFYFSVILVVF